MERKCLALQIRRFEFSYEIQSIQNNEQVNEREKTIGNVSGIWCCKNEPPLWQRRETRSESFSRAALGG